MSLPVFSSLSPAGLPLIDEASSGRFDLDGPLPRRSLFADSSDDEESNDQEPITSKKTRKVTQSKSSGISNKFWGPSSDESDSSDGEESKVDQKGSFDPFFKPDQEIFDEFNRFDPFFDPLKELKADKELKAEKKLTPERIRYLKKIASGEEHVLRGDKTVLARIKQGAKVLQTFKPKQKKRHVQEILDNLVKSTRNEELKEYLGSKKREELYPSLQQTPPRGKKAKQTEKITPTRTPSRYPTPFHDKMFRYASEAQIKVLAVAMGKENIPILNIPHIFDGDRGKKNKGDVKGKHVFSTRELAAEMVDKIVRSSQNGICFVTWSSDKKDMKQSTSFPADYTKQQIRELITRKPVPLGHVRNEQLIKVDNIVMERFLSFPGSSKINTVFPVFYFNEFKAKEEYRIFKSQVKPFNEKDIRGYLTDVIEQSHKSVYLNRKDSFNPVRYKVGENYVIDIASALSVKKDKVDKGILFEVSPKIFDDKIQEQIGDLAFMRGLLKE